MPIHFLSDGTYEVRQPIIIKKPIEQDTQWSHLLTKKERYQ